MFKSLLEIFTHEKRISELESIKEPKVLVIDSAQTPDFNPFVYFKKHVPKGFLILNAISTVKFLQAGWDLSKGGILSFTYNRNSKELENVLTEIIQIRESLGNGLSYEDAMLMEIDTSNSFSSRMTRYDRNMRIMSDGITKYFQERPIGQIGTAVGARFVYIVFSKRISETPNKVRNIHLKLLKNCEKKGIYLMEASSFGMNTPHSHYILHPSEGPCIRISPGSGNFTLIKNLTSTIIETFNSIN